MPLGKALLEVVLDFDVVVLVLDVVLVMDVVDETVPLMKTDSSQGAPHMDDGSPLHRVLHAEVAYLVDVRVLPQ